MGFLLEFTTNVVSLGEWPSGDFVVRLYLGVMEIWPRCFAATFTCVIFDVFPIGTIFAVFGHFCTLPLTCCARLGMRVQVKEGP